MILRSIHLENFGLYAGRQTLDLMPRGRPVVLLGGRNGAGKTTLLEAVRLALYGRRALGFRVAQSEYEQYLRRRIHAGSAEQLSVASVGLEFDYAEGHERHRYSVTRRWSVKGTRTTETLLLEKNGSPVTEVPREEWHTFLHELIPPGVSQLFFFDGEKIAEIARDGADEGLGEAVRGLLGIDLVDRLQTDLGLYLARHAKGEERATAKRYEECVRELANVERDISGASEEVAELLSVHAGHERHVQNVRQRFVAEGGDAASQRVALEAQLREVRDQIGRRVSDVKELAAGLLPFAMAPKLVGRFSRALSQAVDSSLEAAVAVMRQRVLEWRATGLPTRQADWKGSHWDDLAAFLSADEKTPLDDELKWLEVGERTALASRLREARDQIPQRARLLVSELDALANREREIDAELVRAAGHATGMVHEELSQAQVQFTAAEAQYKARKEDLRLLETRRTMLQREKRKLEEAQIEARDAHGRANLAQRVGTVLQRYEDQLLDLKLAQLKSAFVTRFNHLVRKDGFVADVRIDRSTFDTVLIDANGRELHKSSLSAGEKQVYAIAMLWALAHTSGRELPMIIDTPLARLDSEHRTALVERYFPAASHQVIVLSTDTEIDEDLLLRLQPSVSHSFHLVYNHDARATSVQPGYFSDDREQTDALQQA